MLISNLFALVRYEKDDTPQKECTMQYLLATLVFNVNSPLFKL